MTNEQGDMHPSGGVFIGGNGGIPRTLLRQGPTAWRLKKRLVKQYPRSGMETGRGSRKQRATKAPPTSWTGPIVGACGRLLNMRSALLVTAVLMITAWGCASQAASPESATAAPHLENTPRPTHTPAPTTPPATLPAFQSGERESVHQFVRDMVADAALKFGDPAPTDAEYRATCALLRKHDWDSVELFADPDATLQTVGIAGSLAVGFSRLTQIQVERGYAEYSLADFCQDVTGTPAPTPPPATLPATDPPTPNNTPRPTHTPAPTTPATFQPGQREHMYRAVKDIMAETLANYGNQPAATGADYRATCTLLRKHDWDLVETLADPNATLQTGGIAGGLVGVFKELVPRQEERGLAVYSLAHFCEDVTGAPRSNFPPFSPAPGNTSGPTRIPAPIPPAILPTFPPGEREFMYKGAKEMVSDAVLKVGDPAPTEADYRATCTLLRKHDWDLVAFSIDPDSTLQTSGLAGALVEGFKQLTLVRKEHGLAVYSLADFCEDVLEE